MELRAQILDVLTDHPYGMASYQLREYIDAAPQALYAECKKMYQNTKLLCAEGIVTHYSYGSYHRIPTLLIIFAA